MLLQEFDFDIHHRIGVQHVIADYLSRLESGEPANGVQEDFPIGEIFRLDSGDTDDRNQDPEDKWIDDMTYLLTSSLPLANMPFDEKK